MANANFLEMQCRDREVKVLAGRATANATDDLVVVAGSGVAISQGATGVVTLTLFETFPNILSWAFSASGADGKPLAVNVTSHVVATTKTVVLLVQKQDVVSGIYAAFDMIEGDELCWTLIMQNVVTS